MWTHTKKNLVAEHGFAVLLSARKMRAADTLLDAARHGRAAEVEALLTDGVDVNELKTDGTGVTALSRGRRRST